MGRFDILHKARRRGSVNAPRNVLSKSSIVLNSRRQHTYQEHRRGNYYVSDAFWKESWAIPGGICFIVRPIYRTIRAPSCKFLHLPLARRVRPGWHCFRNEHISPSQISRDILTELFCITKLDERTGMPSISQYPPTSTNGDNMQLEPYFSRIRFTKEQKKHWFHDREGLLFGFGVGFYLFLRIPLLGVLIYGIAEASTAYLITKITDPPPPPARSEDFAASQQEWKNKHEFLNLNLTNLDA